MPKLLNLDTRLDVTLTAISRAPRLASDIAIITTSWTRVEEQFGLLLAHCLRSSAFVGVEMYLDLRSAAGQKAVLGRVDKRLQP